MIKRILIVGTSHSVSLCADYDSGLLPANTRWIDYFVTELGYEVINLSMGGCTAQQQFLALYHYLEDHPTEKFDFVIIEGRSIDVRISVPNQAVDTEHWENKEYYEHWLDPSHKWKELYPIVRGTTKFFERFKPNLINWYVEYVYSTQHLIDNVSCNLAMCTLAKQFAPHVFFFSLSDEFHISEKNYNMYNNIAKNILQDYLLDDTHYFKFAPMGDFKKELYFCACGHYNVEGSKILYNKITDILRQKQVI